MENWVNTNFNFISLQVVEGVLESDNQSLIECIRRRPDNEYVDTYIDVADQDQIEEDEREAKEKGYEGLSAYLLAERWDFVQELVDDNYNDDNYPMWNTLFEYRYSPSSTSLVLDKARDAGFGVIEETEHFKPMLFLAGCGYSFYSAHWIPLYLALYPDKAKEYAGVDFDMV